MKYNPKNDSYCFSGGQVPRQRILDIFEVQFADRAHDISRMLARAYAEHFGSDMSPNDKHRYLLDYQRDKLLPEWMLAAYKSRVQAF